MIPFIFFSSLHLPAKKFQIREHCGMLHQFQTRHEYSKSESTKNVRVFAGQNSARKKNEEKITSGIFGKCVFFRCFILSKLLKTPMPTERLGNNSAKVRKVIQTIKLYAQKCSTFIVRCVTFSANAAPVVYQLWLAFGSNNNNVMIIYMS